MNFGVKTNIPSVQSGVLRVARQAPYAMMLALNETANAFQRVQQEAVLRDFTVRQKPFILNTIKRKTGQDFATKQHLVAAVRIDEGRDQLAKFEQGGTKVAIQGKPYVAVPSHELRRNKRGLIPRKFYPSAFKPFVDKPSGITTGADGTFIVPVKGGNRLLLQRVGKGQKNRALYLFVHSVHIPALLQFKEHALAVARSAFPQAIRSAWARAMATAR